MRSITLAGVAALAVLASSAQAQKAGPNGGIVRMSDHHPVEFVSTGTEIAFFIADEGGKPLSTAGSTGRVHLQQGGKTVTVELVGAAPNKLVGKLQAPLAAGTKLVFSTRIHGHTVQLRFEKT